MNKKYTLALFVVMLVSVSATMAQDIQTATSFFDQVSARYGEIEDYAADVTMGREENLSYGRLYYQIPNRVRIDFEQPTGQVLVSDGEVLQVYIPRYNVVLQQALRRRSEQALATLASEQGLNLLRANYSIAFLDSPDPVPLDDDSDEVVVKLILNWRSTNEGYRQLILSVTPNLMIRRIVGVTANYEEITFDFENVETNRGIPDSRFEYEAPASANLFNDFLFEGEG